VGGDERMIVLCRHKENAFIRADRVVLSGAHTLYESVMGKWLSYHFSGHATEE